MDRPERRQLRKRAAAAAKAGGVTVLLEGGPIDGWRVTPDAPCLQAGWGPQQPGYDYGAGPGKWGRYGAVQLRGDGTTVSTWEPSP